MKWNIHILEIETDYYVYSFTVDVRPTDEEMKEWNLKLKEKNLCLTGPDKHFSCDNITDGVTDWLKRSE